MALEVFDFPFHKVKTVNPESGIRGQFGNSYIFTAPPTAPDQRIFKLSFAAMRFYTEGSEVSATVNPTFNMKNLIDFYHAHKLFLSFHYPHPVYGTLEVRFNKPFEEPESLLGGGGTTEAFEVEFIEIPE